MAMWRMTFLLLIAASVDAFGATLRGQLRRIAPAPRAALEAVAATPAADVDATLKKGIASFYDASSGVWETVWGEHMHHGYYGLEGGERKDHQQAQVDMVDEALAWAGVDSGVPPAVHVLDVGCGIGGSSRHIARKFGGSGVGITLSPVQAARANALSRAQGFGDRLQFTVADALQMPFPDNSFDLVWSMESGEHMPDKQKFVSELVRVCKPGGRVIVVAWCHRDLAAGEATLRPAEERLLDRISRAYYLPRWCSGADYVRLAWSHGLRNVVTADWTKSVRRFWPAVILSALRPRNLWRLFRSGKATLRGALVMPLMIHGQKRGTIKFALMSGVKVKPGDPRGDPPPVLPPPAAVAEPQSKPPLPKPATSSASPSPTGFVWGNTY